MPTTTTTVFGVIGCPVEHSLSPAMHAAAIEALGMDAVYLAFRVVPARLSAAVEALRALGIRGLNATIPHKEPLLDLCDEVDDSARDAGCVNTLTNESGRIFGSSTDGVGFLRSLREAGASLRGKRVVLAGSGGSARAILGALLGEGVSGVHLAARNPASRAELARIALERGAPCSQSGLEADEMVRAVHEADVLVNTTPLGMWPQVDGCLALNSDDLPDGLLVVDIVPNPERTVLLERARQAGCQVVGGVGMLVHQGAASFELWTGIAPPTNVMRAACVDALARRREGRP